MGGLKGLERRRATVRGAGRRGEEEVYPTASMSWWRKSEMQKTLALEGLYLFSGAKLSPERKEEQRQSGDPEAKVGKGFLSGEGRVVRRGTWGVPIPLSKV